MFSVSFFNLSLTVMILYIIQNYIIFIQNDTKWYKMIQNDTKVYKSIQKYTKVYKSIQKYTKVYKSIQKYTKLIHTFSFWKYAYEHN